MFIKKNTFDISIFNSKIPVAIVFTMQIQGLAIARCLSEEGVPVLAIDHDRESFGLYSKHVVSALSPNASKEEEVFIDFIETIGRKLKTKGVLLPTHDAELLSLSRHRKQLEKYFIYPMAEYEIIERCVDKFKLYPAAEEIGVPIPKTFFPKSIREVEEIGDKIDYPYIIKPNIHDRFFDIFGKTAIFIKSKTELIDSFKKVTEKNLRVMVQEFIPGRADKLYTLGSYANKESQLLGIFTGKKIRQFPADFGTCRVAEPVHEPQIVELGQKLIKGLKYHGVSQVEFKKDPRDGKFKLMEINARNWMWVSLPKACGVNLPFIAYKNSLGEKIEVPLRQNQAYIKWVYLDNDFKNCCLGGYKKDGHPEEKLSFSRWFKSVRGKKQLAVFSWRDPKPFLMANLFRMKRVIKNISKRF